MEAKGEDDFYNPHGVVTKIVKKVVTIQQHLAKMNEMLMSDSDDKGGGGGGKMMNQCKDKIWCPDKERRAATHAEDYKMYWAPRVRPLNPNSRFGQQMQFLSPGNVRKPEPTRADSEYLYDDENDNHFTWYINQNDDFSGEDGEDGEGGSFENFKSYQPSQRVPSTKQFPQCTRNYIASKRGGPAPFKHMKDIHQREPEQFYHREESDHSSYNSHSTMSGPRGASYRRQPQLRANEQQQAKGLSPRVLEKEDMDIESSQFEPSTSGQQRYERSCNVPQQQGNHSIRIPLVIKLSPIRRRRANQHDPINEERISSREAGHNDSLPFDQQRAVFTFRVPPKLSTTDTRAMRSQPPLRKGTSPYQNDHSS